MTELEKQLMNMLKNEQDAQESEMIALNQERADIVELLTSMSMQQALILKALEDLQKNLKPKEPKKTPEETLKELLKSFQSDLSASLQISLPKALQIALSESLTDFLAHSKN